MAHSVADTWRRAHFAIAMVLLVFLVVHIGNHVAGLWGAEAHIAVMAALRTVYRQPLVEVVLLAAVALQVILGLRLGLNATRYGPSLMGRLQVASGAYIAMFLLAHVSAVLVGRIFGGLDTNYYFAVAGYRSSLAIWFFLPYYFLAVVALFTHLACAYYWRSERENPGRAQKRALAIIFLGVFLSAVLSVSQAGWLAPVDIPQSYLKTYGLSAPSH